MLDMLVEAIRLLTIGYSNAWHSGLIVNGGMFAEKLNMIAQLYLSLTGSG